MTYSGILKCLFGIRWIRANGWNSGPEFARIRPTPTRIRPEFGYWLIILTKSQSYLSDLLNYVIWAIEVNHLVSDLGLEVWSENKEFFS